MSITFQQYMRLQTQEIESYAMATRRPLNEAAAEWIQKFAAAFRRRFE